MLSESALWLSGLVNQMHLGCDVDAPIDRFVHGTFVLMHFVNAIYCFSMLRIRLEGVADVYAFNDQHTVFLLDFSGHIRYEVAVTRRNPARLQRAA